MILQFLRDLIPWLAPPIIGAVIGYVTNDIAIRMLFRPLKPVKFLGLHVPFTPGIFPKERYTLSRSIGSMVSRELITEDAVRRQVHAEKTQAQLSASVSDLTTGFFSTTISRLSEGVSSVISGSFEQLARDVIRRFLTSRDLVASVQDIITRAVSTLSETKARGLLERWGILGFVSDRLLPILAEPATRARLSDSAGAAIAGGAGGLLSDALVSSLSDLALPLVNPAADRLMAWLRSPEMRKEIEGRGRRLVSDVLDKLNLFQRFFVTAGQFGRKLDEKMPEIVEDALASLEMMARDAETQKRLVDTLASALKDWRDAGSDGGGAARGVSRLLDSLLSGLEKPGARKAVVEALQRFLLDGGDPTVGQVLGRLMGLGETEMVERLSTLALEYLSRPDIIDAISTEVIRFAGRFLEANADKALGEVLGVDAVRKEKIDSFLTERLVSLVDAKLPEILRGLDVETLVVEKIDSLDVRDVEKLILGIIASHLRWIDIFGAILGGVIGMFQLLLKLLHVS